MKLVVAIKNYGIIKVKMFFILAVFFILIFKMFTKKGVHIKTQNMFHKPHILETFKFL